MRKTLIAATAAFMALSGAAFAQTMVITQDPVVTNSTVVMPGEVRTYVLEQSVPSVAYDGTIAVGTPAAPGGRDPHHPGPAELRLYDRQRPAGDRQSADPRDNPGRRVIDDPYGKQKNPASDRRVFLWSIVNDISRWR